MTKTEIDDYIAGGSMEVNRLKQDKDCISRENEDLNKKIEKLQETNLILKQSNQELLEMLKSGQDVKVDFTLDNDNSDKFLR